MARSPWKKYQARLASGFAHKAGHLWIRRSFVAFTSTTWWDVGTTPEGGSLRAFTSLAKAKAWAESLPLPERS